MVSAMIAPLSSVCAADVLHVTRGDAPLLVSCPHAGTQLPDEIAARLTEAGLAVPDTDWYVDRLWDFCRVLGATMLVPRYSRYVVDLNRPPDDSPLYPGMAGTGLVPERTFAGDELYRGAVLDADERGARVDAYWRPYHAALATEIARLRRAHPRIVLIEAHSIPSLVPMLFDGRLPDINVGTADGASASAGLLARFEPLLAAQETFSWVVNGRFKGGYITRHYGQPVDSVEAVQFEIAQCAYMDEGEACWNEAKSCGLVPLLERIARAALDHAAGLATIPTTKAGRG